MARKVKIEDLADVIISGLNEYANLTGSEVKKAVRATAKSVKEDIQENAPKRTGEYAKSWGTKVTEETSESISITVYSKSKYYIAHLLEHGHAKRNGKGRVAAQPHIIPAQERGEKMLEAEIEKRLKKI